MPQLTNGPRGRTSGTAPAAKPSEGLEPWVGTQVVADHLGKPESWVYANVQRLGIPHRRLGKQFRYRLSEVDAWMNVQRGTRTVVNA